MAVAKYSPGRRKKKQDPMLIGMCVFGAVVLIAIPVVSGILFSNDKNKVKETEIVGWNNNEKGDTCYYLPNHEKAVGQTVIGTDTYFFDEDGGITPGWRKHDKKLFYVDKKGKICTGLTYIKDDLYYFNDASDSKAFEMFKGDLKIVTPEEDKSDINHVYYFDNNGKAIKGFKVTASGDAYYFGDEYFALTGLFEGSASVMTLDGKEISPDEYDSLSEEEKAQVTENQTTKYFYADEDGKLQRGWVESFENGSTVYHYFTNEYYSASGEYKDIEFNGEKMDFDFDEKGTYIPDSGKSETTKAVTTTTTKGSEKNNSNKEDLTAGWHEKEDGSKYYVDKNQKAAVGLTDIEGKKYIFNDQGVMLKGHISIGNDHYFAGQDGALISGRIQDGNLFYLFDSNTYKMLTGLQNINGGKMFFDPDGRQVFSDFRTDGNDVYYFSSRKDDDGKCVTGFIRINGKNYWFDDSGKRMVGWHSFQENGAIYYFDPENEGKMAAGYTMIDGDMYYFDPNGSLQLGFVPMNGTIFYFGENGIIVEGDYEYEGAVHHFDSSGRMVPDAE